MMKQVELRRGARVLRGWVDAAGTNGVPVAVGRSVAVPSEGGIFDIVAVHGHQVDRAAVKSMQDKARNHFTALQSHRGNK